MVLEPELAAVFIHGYKTVLLEIGGSQYQDLPVFNQLALARDKLVRDPGLLDTALMSLEQKSIEVDARVIAALRSLKVKHWIYLRDSRAYSVFLDDEEAYAVLGLTDRLRDIIGDSGAFIETGLVAFAGRFVCDGIISQVVWLGRGIRGSCNEDFRRIRAQKHFYLTPGTIV